MDIYQAGYEHHAEIMKVWEASVRATHYFLSDEDIARYKQLLNDDYIHHMSLYCAKRHGNITGFIGLNDGMVQALFVKPQARGQGVGKRLLQYAINEHAVNQVDVNEQNDKALGFYQKMGFEVTSRSEFDGAGKPYPILKMHLA